MKTVDGNKVIKSISRRILMEPFMINKGHAKTMSPYWAMKKILSAMKTNSGSDCYAFVGKHLKKVPSSCWISILVLDNGTAIHSYITNGSGNKIVVDSMNEKWPKQYEEVHTEYVFPIKDLPSIEKQMISVLINKALIVKNLQEY